MNVTLPLDRMSRAEKMRAMESLWDDLCRDPEGTESPAWHGEVLRQREGAVQAGTEAILDWRDAKRRVRESAP